MEEGLSPRGAARERLRSPARFLVLSGLSFALNLAFTAALHEGVGLGADASFALALVAVFLVNFTLMRWYVFPGGNLYNAGLAYCRMSEWDEARRVLEIVTRQDPEQGHGFHLLGVAQLNLGHLEEAERALRRAKELLPSDAAIAEALRQLRRQREAARPK